MNESIRTLVFVGVGTLAALTAFATRPVLDRSTTGTDGVTNLVGKQLFPEFKDPLAAKSLEIKEFDEAAARRSRSWSRSSRAAGG